MVRRGPRSSPATGRGRASSMESCWTIAERAVSRSARRSARRAPSRRRANDRSGTTLFQRRGGRLEVGGVLPFLVAEGSPPGELAFDMPIVEYLGLESVLVIPVDDASAELLGV